MRKTRKKTAKKLLNNLEEVQKRLTFAPAKTKKRRTLKQRLESEKKLETLTKTKHKKFGGKEKPA